MGNRQDAIHNVVKLAKRVGSSNFVKQVNAKTGARFWIWMAGSIVAWLILYAVVPKNPQDSFAFYQATPTDEILLIQAQVPTAIVRPTVERRATPTAKPTSTFKVPSTVAPLPTLTATVVPSIALLATERAKLTLTPNCTGKVAQQFLAVWPSLKATLGCPGRLTNTTQFAYQNFQHGELIWRGLELDSNNVTPSTDETFLALFTDSSWQLLQSVKFNAGDPLYTCPELGPPQSYLTPKRGFGKLLCNRPDVRQKLGSPITSEIGYPTSFVQEFDNGFLVHYHRSNNTWQTIAFFYAQDAKSGTWKPF